MISRRRFLEAGGVTAGMAVTSQAWAAAAKSPDDASLPPSLGEIEIA